MFKICDDGRIEPFHYAGLTSLQAAVGGYVEMISVRHPESGHVAVFWLNEHGKFEPNRVNEIVTVLLHEHSWLPKGDYVVGDVVVTGADGPEVADLDYDWKSFFQDLARAANS